MIARDNNIEDTQQYSTAGGKASRVPRRHTNSRGTYCVPWQYGPFLKISAITMRHGCFPDVITEIPRNGWLPWNCWDTMSPVGDMDLFQSMD